MLTKPLPSQAECNPSDPEEHFLWALRNMPSFAGSGVITHSGFLRKWARHLWEAGFRHRDWLAGLADENGNIHVSKLPEQKIKFQEAFRGPHHTYNNAAGWVGADAKDPPPTQIPDIRKLTAQERMAYYYQFQALGMIPAEPAKPPVSEAFNEEGA